MIKKEAYVPPTKASRSEIVQALRDLKEGESLLISGDSLTDRTRGQIYKAASRERLAISTQRTPIGLRVWLKSSERASIERESELKADFQSVPPELMVFQPDYYPPTTGLDNRTKEQKQRYLAEYFGGEIEVEPREAMKEIDETNAPEMTEPDYHPDEYSQAAPRRTK